MNGHTPTSPGSSGVSLEQMLKKLEERLIAPVPSLSAYHDLPFAIFLYDPAREFELRSSVKNLVTRLKTNHGKEVVTISLAHLMYRAVEEARGLDRLAAMEMEMGLELAVQTVHRILSGKYPLHQRVKDELERRLKTSGLAPDPAGTVLFLTRAGALFPAFRTSALLEKLQGLVHVPTVLFYPGTLEGIKGLRFMGICQPDHNYRPEIYGVEGL